MPPDLIKLQQEITGDERRDRYLVAVLPSWATTKLITIRASTRKCMLPTLWSSSYSLFYGEISLPPPCCPCGLRFCPRCYPAVFPFRCWSVRGGDQRRGALAPPGGGFDCGGRSERFLRGDGREEIDPPTASWVLRLFPDEHSVEHFPWGQASTSLAP